MKKVEIGECVNILIPVKDNKEFWDIITSEGYTKDGNGVFNYIMETETENIEEESEQTKNDTFDDSIPLSGGALGKEAFSKWAQENPEEWAKAKKKGTDIVGSLLSKIAKKL